MIEKGVELFILKNLHEDSRDRVRKVYNIGDYKCLTSAVYRFHTAS
ncbi:MAG: hypothetical protein V7K97_24070 [Nostoc sp.]